MDASGLLLSEESARLLTCVHCGFCLPACPTYTLLGDENDSPRGRIVLMRAVAEGRLPVSGAFETHIDRCLGCLACETACPAGVEYGVLLESAVQDRRAAGGQRRFSSGSGSLGWLTGRRRSGLLYALGRMARRTGMARAFGKLPGRAGLAGRLLAATAPLARPAGGSGSVRTRAVGGRRRRESCSREAPPRLGVHTPAVRTPAADFVLFEGCAMRGLFPHVHAAACRSLTASGFEQVRAPGQVCCGALHAHAGDGTAAAALARRNIEAFEQALNARAPSPGPSLPAPAAGPRTPKSRDLWLAVDSAGCGAALRDYPRWLRADGAWKRRAERLAACVRDVSELLADPPSPTRGRLEGRAACDAPCHLLHAQGVDEAPLRMLRRIDGLVLSPLPSSDRCCGGAGIYNLTRPQLSRAVLEPKLQEIAAGGFDWVLTGNPGCIMQIGAGLLEWRLPTRAVHPVELLDRALGACD